MLPRHLLTASAVVCACTVSSVWAQTPAANAHAGHAMPASSSDAKPASTLAYEAVNQKMHQDMAITYTGNADRDFIAGMIPHHQGAIDMARVALAHGRDPRVRKLAKAVIAAQTPEIQQMQRWLKEMDDKK